MSNSHTQPDPTNRQQHLLMMASRLEHLHVTGEYSDFIIKCESRVFKVHKAVVCPQSGFLKRLSDPSFKEGQAGEAVLEETDSILLEQAIRFLYTGTYVDTNCGTTIASNTNLNTPSNDSTTCDITLAASALVVVSEQGIEPETPSESSIEIIDLPADSDGSAVDHPQLSFNVRMYILADYLEIPQLRCQALDRCTAILENEFQPDLMIGPLRFALENTNNTDKELRSTIFRLCGEKRNKIAAGSPLDVLLSQEEPIAWKLLKDQHAKHSELLDNSELEGSRLAAEILTLELQLRDLRHESRDLRHDLNGAKAALRRKEDQLDDCVRLSQKWNGCRHCNVDFDVELERHRNTGEYFIRCKKCRCRHEEY